MKIEIIVKKGNWRDQVYHLDIDVSDYNDKNYVEVENRIRDHFIEAANTILTKEFYSQ